MPIEATIFLSGPIALLAPFLKISFGSVCQKHSPRCFEVGARQATGIEPAGPTPRLFMMRNASAERDRADAHVTEVDMPTFLAGVGRVAAGEGGHAPMTPPI
jgi:hypothetical protein